MSDKATEVIVNGRKITPEFIDLINETILMHGNNTAEFREILFYLQAAMLMSFKEDTLPPKNIHQMSHAVDELYTFLADLDSLIGQGKF